jgi:hypothetical protein
MLALGRPLATDKPLSSGEGEASSFQQNQEGKGDWAVAPGRPQATPQLII